ncbi:helix-turn-helix transcriptional regulator [Actinocorallia aurantiaca]|uniref:Helix-turn-helix transcriptional regulator n=1 Tax=Actinocorallia aurantiaca TaxID=46204 RepID=A0ABN3UIA2_9ACTN
MPARSDPHASPAIRAFANELTARREMAGHNKADLAALLGYTAQFIGQLEACKNVPSRKVAEDLETFFKTDGVFPRLWENINDTRNVAALPPGFADYLTRESQAAELRIYSALLVEGLFQAEGYARTIMGVLGTSNTEDLISKRLDRKLIFEREYPPHVWFIMDEGVIRRVIGSPRVMFEQLRYLYELSQQPRFMLQIVPYAVGYHEGLGGSLTLLGFEDGPSIGYTESAGVGVLVEQPSGVSDLGVRYDLLRGYALPVHESRTMLKEAMESYERLGTDSVAQEQP